MSLFWAILFPLLLPVSWAACTDVHLFLARGNGEGYPGRVGAVYNSVCNGLSSCDYENIEFDSSQTYCKQASDGVSSGLSQIAAYASACPDSKLVLGGYSLGAQIVGDILGGGGGSYYNCDENPSSALSANSNAGKKIAAVLLFGDVRHVANEPYNVGTGSGANGQYPRSGTSLSDLNEYSSIMQSYCLSTDPICALGDDGESHTTYMTVYADSAGAWVQKIIASGAVTSTPAATSKVMSTDISTPTTITSIGVQTAGGSTTSLITTSTAVAVTLTPGVVATSPTSSVNSATFSPFVFSNTTAVASTSTSIPMSPASALSFTTTISTAIPTSSTPALSFTATTTASTSSPTNGTSTSSQLPTYAQSNGGAYLNSAHLALNLVTLIAIKVLVF